MANLIIKKPNDILTDMLRTLEAGLIGIGVSNPQVGQGSDYYIMFSAIANELAVAENNVNLQADALMPDTATGTDLDRILGTYGLSRRSASTANGALQFVTSQSTLVPANSQLTSNTGNIYQVTVGGIYSNGNYIPIQSVSTGSGVNLDVGEVLSWNSTPAFAQSTAAVIQAVSGGVDAEDDQTARNRLLARLQNPPAMGNWQQVAEMCEELDPVIQKAFIYPVANGPSTLHVALTAYPTSASVTRELAATKVTSLTSAIQGQLPEYVDSYISTVTDVPVDVSFNLILPYPLGALNLGTGGGWVDFQPFPIATISRPYYTAETVTSSTSFTMIVDGAAPAPINGVTHISWIDRTNGYLVKTATIVSATYTVGIFYAYYTIVIDTPFVGLTTGDYIFPSAINAQTYVNAVLAHFALMGPGEKTNVSTLLPRAYRKPRPNLSYPYTVDGTMLKAVIESSAEVEAADYWYRTYTTAPALPTVINSPPNIYIPQQIGFYPASIT